MLVVCPPNPRTPAWLCQQSSFRTKPNTFLDLWYEPVSGVPCYYAKDLFFETGKSTCLWLQKLLISDIQKYLTERFLRLKCQKTLKDVAMFHVIKVIKHFLTSATPFAIVDPTQILTSHGNEKPFIPLPSAIPTQLKHGKISTTLSSINVESRGG